MSTAFWVYRINRKKEFYQNRRKMWIIWGLKCNQEKKAYFKGKIDPRSKEMRKRWREEMKSLLKKKKNLKSRKLKTRDVEKRKEEINILEAGKSENWKRIILK